MVIAEDELWLIKNKNRIIVKKIQELEEGLLNLIKDRNQVYNGKLNGDSGRYRNV